MGSDVGQIFLTASLHRDHSISYALVCEKNYVTLPSIQYGDLNMFRKIANLNTPFIKGYCVGFVMLCIDPDTEILLA